MICKDITPEEAKLIYETKLIKDFPPEEVKPFKSMMRMYHENQYRFLGFYEQDELMAYAYMVNFDHFLLLDYFAVISNLRGKGTGSKCLNILKEQMKDVYGIIIETENIACASNDTELHERIRRNDFYRRNGVRETKVREIIYDAAYQNWYYPVTKHLTDDEVLRESIHFYEIMIPGERNKKYVKIWLESNDEGNLLYCVDKKN